MVICCLLLSACASTPITSIPEAVAQKNWNGHPVYEAIAKWGKPHIQSAGDGTTIYQWEMGGNYSHTEYVSSVDHNMFGDMVTSHPEQRVVTHQCTVSITADPTGTITNFETIHNVPGTSGCGEFFYGSDSVSPDAASATKGKLLLENIGKAKKLDAQYKAVCAKPDYAVLFSDPHCDDSIPFAVAAGVKIFKLTPTQKDLFAKWRAEMTAVVSSYQVFLRSTQIPADKILADAMDKGIATMNASIEKSKMPLASESATARTAQALSGYVRRTYLQYGI